MRLSRAAACRERLVNTIETWYPVCLLPVQAMTTPEQLTLPSPPGDLRVMVISFQGANGVAVRNSMPLRRRMTELGDKERRASRASIVTWGRGAVLTNFLALIQVYPKDIINVAHAIKPSNRVKYGMEF